jgi:hypothetical protein
MVFIYLSLNSMTLATIPHAKTTTQIKSFFQSIPNSKNQKSKIKNQKSKIKIPNANY